MITWLDHVITWLGRDPAPRVRPFADHAQEYQSDTGIPGTYVPNMSAEDQRKWKGKLIRGKDPRVEVRRRCGQSLVLLVVRYKGPGLDVTLSANGKVELPGGEWGDLDKVVREAYNRLVEERGCHQAAT